MIYFLNILSFLLEWAYVFVFFWILHTFLPVRQKLDRAHSGVFCLQLFLP